MAYKIFYLVGVSEDENGKNCAFVITTHNSTNLLSTLKQYKNLKYVNLCEGKKKAEMLCEVWNKDFIRNKTYAFGG